MGKLYIKTYGCQMNFYDSALISNKIQALGFTLTDNCKNADIIVLNTCHIREKAADKMYSELGRIRNAVNSDEVTIVVAGCVAQAEGQQIFQRAPYVNVVVGPQSLQSVDKLIQDVISKKNATNKSSRTINLEFDVDAKFASLAEELNTNTSDMSALLSVQEGCNKFCTFCVVPYTRGGEFSRPVIDVYNDAKSMAKKGIREIVLLGQNVNGYHGDNAGVECSLGALMMRLNDIDGIERIRYTTSHPIDMHDDLYKAHASSRKVMPFLNLPVQSGSDRILKSMNRKYSAQEYIDIINKLRQETAGDIAISSDFIVGFPGETEKDFECTMDLVETVGFASSYSFKYSPRPGTPGADYPDQVLEEVKSYRLSMLQELLNKQKLQYNQSFVGKKVEVMFDFMSQDGKVYGRTPHMQLVYSCDKSLYKTISEVEIGHANKNSLVVV